MRLIRAADLARACSMAEAIEAVADGFIALADKRATVPMRLAIPLEEHGSALIMPAALRGSPAFSVKVVSVTPANAARSLPLVNAVALLIDAQTGLPLALLDGTALTALRTGAAGGVAARALAREDAHTLALFGTGAQARMQLLAALDVRPIRDVRVVSRDAGHARDFGEWAVGAAPGDVRIRPATADEAVSGADLVVTATSSATPVFDGSRLGPGVHVTAVGSYRPDMRELDDETLREARIVVDQRDAALAEAGELAGREGLVELGEVLSGRAEGRRDDAERTVFKSVGNAVQDLVVAALVYDRAIALGLGDDVRWP